MATITLNPGTGGEDVLTDELSSANVQLVKLTYGESNDTVRVTSTARLPVEVPKGLVDSGNSSSTPLSGGGAFTGTGIDISDYSTVTVIYDTDVDGSISMQFSTDNSNWDRAKVVPVDQTIASGAVHTLEVVARYFRVVYTNGASAQGHFRIQTILHAFRSGFLTSSPDQKISKINDAQIVRVSNDPFIDLSRGLYADKSVVHKFGANADLGTTERDVWSYGGAGAPYGDINYPWPDTTETVVITSDSANDAASTATGAQKLMIEGLDGNWAPVSEEVTMNGATGVTTSASFRRVYRAYVTDVGTYGGSNAGNITLKHTTSTDVVAFIEAGAGQTFMSMYTVPAGYTAYLRHAHASVATGTNKDATVKIWRRLNADDVAEPFVGGAKRLLHKWFKFNGAVELDFYAMPSFPEKADIWASAVASGAGSSVDVAFDLVLVKGDSPTSPQ